MRSSWIWPLQRRNGLPQNLNLATKLVNLMAHGDSRKEKLGDQRAQGWVVLPMALLRVRFHHPVHLEGPPQNFPRALWSVAIRLVQERARITRRKFHEDLPRQALDQIPRILLGKCRRLDTPAVVIPHKG
jgi:hypothetical protein